MLTQDDRRGYTLLEIVASVILLALVWVAALNLIFVGRIEGSRASHRAQAIYVMQQTIEDLRKKTFAGIATSTATVSLDTRGTPDSTADDVTATRVVAVTAPSTYYKKVAISLTWKERVWGAARDFTEYCGTYIANDPQAN